MADYYHLLGVSDNASEADIRAAYRKKAKMYHPDVNKSPDAHSLFVLLTSAYETLINPHKRQRYNDRTKRSVDNLQTYQEWVKARKAKAEFEARMRYYEFLQNREKFRQSRFYFLAVWVTQIARVVAWLFGIAIVAICLYIIYDVHFVLIFLLLPFICAGIYLMKCTNDWYKETRKYF